MRNPERSGGNRVLRSAKHTYMVRNTERVRIFGPPFSKTHRVAASLSQRGGPKNRIWIRFFGEDPAGTLKPLPFTRKADRSPAPGFSR